MNPAKTENDMRTFLAIEIPANPCLDNLQSQLLYFEDVLRIVRPENYHMTVRFFGETDDGQLKQLRDEISAVVSDVPKFELQLVGLGTFPNLSSPRVLWVGVNRTDTLIQIADEIERHARTIGFPPDKKAFKPHLTIARTKRKPPSAMAEFVKQHSESEFVSVSVEKLTLFQSELKPDGPVYEVIEEFPLGN